MINENNNEDNININNYDIKKEQQINSIIQKNKNNSKSEITKHQNKSGITKDINWQNLNSSTNFLIVGLFANIKQNVYCLDSRSREIAEFLEILEKASIEYLINIKSSSLNSESYHKKVYQFIELFIKQEQSTNILTDSFLMFIIEYLELITKTDYGRELKETYYISLKEEIIKLISVINNKKIEYTNGVNDSLNLLHTCKIQALLLNICSSYIEIEVLDTLNFIINNIQIVFNLTKQTNTDSMFEILVSIIKDIVIKNNRNNNNSNNNGNNTTKKISIFQVISVMTSITNKTLEIATNKDILKETLDYTTQSHMVTSLVNYLKCINILGKGFFNNEEFYSKCTKSVISLICSLSFWENCSVMDQTAQLILVYWNTKVNNYDYNRNISKNNSSINSISQSNPDLPTNIKFNIEIIIEYFFNKKLKEYYNYFNKIYGNNRNIIVEEEEEHLADIVSKQAGLELVMTYLSYFCLENLFLKTIYTNFDLLKIGNCLLFEILSNMNKFYSLYNSRFSFVQNIISVVTENILDFIYQMNIENNSKLGKSLFNERRNSNSDKKVSFNDELSTVLLDKNIKFWNEAVDVINLGKYKKLFAFVQEHFGVINTTVPKGRKKNKETVEVQEVKINNDNETKNNDQNIESKENKDTNSENPNESSNSLSSLPNTNNSINKTYSTNSNLNSNNLVNTNPDNNTSNYTNTQETVTLHKQKSQASLTSTTSSQSADTSQSQQNLQHSVIDETNLNKIKQRNREIAKLIAILLRYSQLINTNIIFEIIGMNDDFSGEVLSEYLNTFNFTDMDILSAYRLLISTFKLGGEAYILYNIILEFSKKYFENNKGKSVFTNEDQVSTFAYSILMLNTDLHDPGVKEHMKVDEFIKNNHMTGLFNDIPHDYFRNIYKSIQTNPLKIAACRKNDYPKSDEVFDNLHSKNLFYNKNKKEILGIVNNRVLEDIDNTRNNENKENNDYFDSEILYDISSITKEQFPYLLTIAKLNNNPHSKLHISKSDIEKSSSDSVLSAINKNEVLISKLFFEDFFQEFNNISNNFYNMNIEMSEKIIKKMCELSSIHNKPEYIEKLLINITKLISSKDTSTNKLNTYNLYFLISINYVDKLSSYIEVFFNNLIEFIKLNINNQITAKNAEMSINSVASGLVNNNTTDSNSSSTNTLIRKELNVIEKCYSQLFKFDYLSLLDKVINYSYVILFKKKMMKNDSYFGFIFGSSAPSKDDYQRGLEQFRILMLKQLKLNYYTYNNNKENKENVSSKENILINSTTNKNSNSQTNTNTNIPETIPQDNDITETVKNLSNTTNTTNTINTNTKIINTNKTPDIKELNDNLDITQSNLSTLYTITKISKSSNSSEINIHNILSVIRSKEEDFLFFLNLASLKILEYKEFNEMFYSIIFLNEIIMEDLDEKEFLKIWHNLLNILHNKLDIKENFGEKENNVFEIVLINDLVTTIIAKHITYIESEDYFYFLEKYLEIENNDLIFIILENNNKIVKKSFNKNILIKEDIMETLLSLFLKYVTDANFNYSNNSNNSLNLEIQRMSLVIKYLTNLFKVLPSINFFSSDCVDLCVKIVKILKEKRVEKTLLFSLIKEIVKKIETSEISFSDTKWDLFMQLFNFILHAILIDNVKVQNDYLLLLSGLIKEVKIPMLKFKEIYTSLNTFYINSINIRDKSVYYWERIFCLFNYIFKSNKELVNSDFDMENLWCLFIRKFLISFVDSKQYSKKKNANAKSNDKTYMSDEQIMSDERSLLLLGEIVDYVKGSIIENISPPKWWESCKNTIVLYFPNLINKTQTNNIASTNNNTNINNNKNS